MSGGSVECRAVPASGQRAAAGVGRRRGLWSPAGRGVGHGFWSLGEEVFYAVVAPPGRAVSAEVAPDAGQQHGQPHRRAARKSTAARHFRPVACPASAHRPRVCAIAELTEVMQGDIVAGRRNATRGKSVHPDSAPALAWCRRRHRDQRKRWAIRRVVQIARTLIRRRISLTVNTIMSACSGSSSVVASVAQIARMARGCRGEGGEPCHEVQRRTSCWSRPAWSQRSRTSRSAGR